MPFAAAEASVSAMEDLGARFWLSFAGVMIGGAIALFIVLMLFTRAIFAWGIFGTFVVVALLALVAGWIFDRRQARHRVP